MTRSLVAHGIDIVGLGKLSDLVSSAFGEVTDWLTDSEAIAFAELSEGKTAYLGGRIAAKEAVAKALGSGIAGDIVWGDIEILNLPTGQPRVRLQGAALLLARELGISDWLLSVSHDDNHAVASALAFRDE